MQPTATYAEILAPTLKIDGLLYKGRTLPAQARLERRIAANLIAFMQHKGWDVQAVWDGEENVEVEDMVEAMELLFNLDEARLYFKMIAPPEEIKTEGRPIIHSVVLVMGQGVDMVADWSYSEGDPDGFDAAMSDFDAEAYA